MTDPSEKKMQARARLLEMQYPRRASAVFASASDHNPLVLEDCPECRGTGATCVETTEKAIMDTCARCAGRGITGQIVRCVPEDSADVRAATVSGGWLSCPWCGRNFSLRDHNAWTGPSPCSVRRQNRAYGRALRPKPVTTVDWCNVTVQPATSDWG